MRIVNKLVSLTVLNHKSQHRWFQLELIIDALIILCAFINPAPQGIDIPVR